MVDAAQAAGVGVRTVKRRCADPQFMRQVRRQRAELLEQAAGRLVAGLSAAVLTLSQLLVDDDANVRLKASDKLLTHAVRMTELVTLEQRVAQLEQAADDSEYHDDDHDDGEGDEPEIAD